MKHTLGIILLSFLVLSARDKTNILIGEITSSGKSIKIQGGEELILEGLLSIELGELRGKKIRFIGKKGKQTIAVERYEIAPFAYEQNLPAWTIKQIPKYVSGTVPAFNPKVSPDGGKLFWTALIDKKKSSTQKIWVSEADENGFWNPGKQMDAPLNNELPSAVISALPGGNELFVFGSFVEEELVKSLEKEMINENQRIAQSSKTEQEYKKRFSNLQETYQKKLDKIYNRVPLYKSSRSGNSWTTPKGINFPDFYNLYRRKEAPNQQVFGGSTLSGNGNILIYSSMHGDTYGKLDLYVSQADPSGRFPLGKNFGKILNTTEEEMAPFLASDDRTLYFCSTGRNKLTIFVTKRVGDGWNEWTQPVEISRNLQGVNFFTIPASGNWAYISKNGELQMAYIPEEARPNPVVIIKGVVKNDKGEPIGTEIHYESLKNNKEIGKTVSDPTTGNFSLVVPFGERYGFYAKKEGYLPVHKNIDLRDSDQIYREIKTELILPEIKAGKEITINNLFFESNKFKIKKESEPELDRLGSILQKNKNLKISIEGHTDTIGSDKDNLALSKARAKSVVQYLTQKYQIENGRLYSKGFGETKPVANNSTSENRQKNRRVIFRILE